MLWAQPETEGGVGSWLPQTLISFAGCVEGAKLIHFPKITRRHGRELLLQMRRKKKHVPANPSR